MLYFAIEMDENKLKEKGYDVQEVYNCIADAYQGLQGKLAFIENNIRFYTRDKNDGNDFQRLWRVSLGLRKKDWFIENVKGWEFIKVNEKGNVYYAEDLINDVRIL